MKRLLALVTIFALTAAPLATRLEAAPAAAGTGLSVPVSGSTAAGVTPAGNFTGAFRITRFVNSGGTIFAQGVLTGIATNTTTGVSESIVQTVSTPVSFTDTAGATPAAISAQAVCNILHLVLGPIDLNLLGLHITTNQIVLDITAESGPGNLLGNLLCAVTNLLNGGGPATQIANLLTQILGILQGL
jgi:hypothetical protein